MMRKWGIRARAIVVAVVPAIVLATFMIMYYTNARLGDLENAFNDRGRALAQRIATATEYAVFANNREDLVRLLDNARGEADVRGVLITDSSGAPLARSGDVALAAAIDDIAEPRQSTHDGMVRFREPILPIRLNVEGLIFEGSEKPPAAAVLGSVVLDLSRRRLDAQRAELLWTGAGALLLVLFGSVVLAIRMSEGVSQPIRDAARVVSSIGSGKLHQRMAVRGGGSLRRLAEGVNEMAARLESSHGDMARRIDDATAELRERKDEAERADLAKSRFLAAASHDLRQPMHALGLFIAELAEEDHPPATRHLVRQIRAAAEAMENLLDSLLDISRLDAGALQPKIRACPVQPVLDRIANDFRIWAEERNLRLRVRPCDAWVTTDPLLLERILSNLVSNAIRYTPAGTIMVACRMPDADRIRIEVRDSGTGIDDGAQHVIFQEFVQLGNPERSRSKGLGLGLAIVRRLTQLLGHGVTLRSAPGRGSVFAVTLARAAATAAPYSPVEPRAPGNLSGVCVAILDDDPMALESLDSLLSAWECEVISAATLPELLSALSVARRPDALICDYRLQGGMTGLEAIATVRDIGHDIRTTIVISGDTTTSTLKSVRSAGFPLLYKPVRPAKLRALMQRLVAHPADDELTEDDG